MDNNQALTPRLFQVSDVSGLCQWYTVYWGPSSYPRVYPSVYLFIYLFVGLSAA